MEKIVEQGLLYDFYGSLLTGHQQKIYEQVVYDNLSLNEVAETEGVSKQAVHDLVRRCTTIMRGYENKLGMIRRFGRIRESADRLRQIISLAQECLGELEDIEEDPMDSGAKSEEQDPANDEEQKKLEALLKEADNIINKEEV